MLAAVLVAAALAVPAAAFVLPAHSGGRSFLAHAVMWWTLLLLFAAWLAYLDLAFSTDIDGTQLRVRTLSGRRTIDLHRLTHMSSFSMWGRFGASHMLRLHTEDGRGAMVMASMPLVGLNRNNALREVTLRRTLAAYADKADDRARYWLGVGPRPPRLRTARHVLAMMLLYALGCVVLVFAVAGYLTAALD